MTISLVIHGNPRSKGRPRFSVRGGYAVAFTDKETKKYEQMVKASAQAVMAGRDPLEGPVWVRIDAFIPIPKSTPKYKQALMRAGEMRPAKKPDLDNIAKAILDGINAIVFVDDSQVCALGLRKFYSDHPRVETTVGQIPEPENARKTRNSARQTPMDGAR